MAPKAKDGLTLSYMLRSTPYNVAQHADEKNILKMEITKSKKGRPSIRALMRRDKKPGDKVDTHTVWVIGLENKPKFTGQKLMVSCDCHNFMFQWEYALTHYGASKIKYCNGNPPHITNPGLVPGVCSHLFALLEKIKQRGL